MPRNKKVDTIGEGGATSATGLISGSSDVRKDSGLCKFFVNSGECFSGAECRFAHPPVAELKAVRREWVAQRVAQRKKRSQRDEDPFDPAQKLKKTARAHVFAKWIKETFPQANNVVDVAGGKGLVGLLLENQQDSFMKATLVDPRAREVSKQMLRVLAKQGKSDTQSEIELALNAHAQEWFTDPPNEAVSALLSQPDALIIGLHPDQATEPIVDIGLRQNIPWAIVPCCVFPQLYPDRIWPGEEGGQVNSTEKLIDWLKTKDPGIREAYLPFEGRNRVLYWFGREAVNQDTLHSTPSIQNEVI